MSGLGHEDRRSKTLNDPVHGYIRLNELCVSLMDTPQFQRLRDLKQLGTLYYVFPGGSHNRFEHSVGVGYLAGETVERFRMQQPELELVRRDTHLLSAAGLLHDLGHGPFSHVFDSHFMPLVRPNSNYSHEEMSNKMMELLIDENHIDIDRHEIRFMQQLIVGAKEHSIKPVYSVASSSKGFLYEIVANGRNCIDVDKFDYLARDMQNLFGNRKGFNFSRLWMYNRVIDDQICYHNSVSFDIYDMFQQRYQMHKQIYTHRKGCAIEYMICDAMALADQELGISKATERAEDFQYLTDHIINTIECSKSVELEPARKILKRLRCRQLYAFVDEILLPPELMSIPKMTAEAIATCNVTSGLDLRPDDIIVSDGKLNYNLKDRNPVDNVAFYNNSNPNEIFYIPKKEVSLLFPEKFEERVLRVYSRSQDPQVQDAILCAFRKYLSTFSRTLPSPSPSSKILPRIIKNPRKNSSSTRALTDLLSSSQSDVEPLETEPPIIKRHKMT